MRNISTILLIGLITLATTASAADLAPRRPALAMPEVVNAEPAREQAPARPVRRRPRSAALPIQLHHYSASPKSFAVAARKAKEGTREGRAVAVTRRVARPAPIVEVAPTTLSAPERDIEMMPRDWTTRAQGATPARPESNGPFGSLK